MAQPELMPFHLVGGTALALQIGHRISVDADFFGMAELEEIDLSGVLSRFGPTTILKKTKNIQILSVSGIKVDVVNYRYTPIEPILELETLRLASLKDIAAMKLNAIAGRGSRKDFTDLFFLLRHFSLSQMLGFYNEKYSDGSEFMVKKSLTYFADADGDSAPQMLEDISWSEIKEVITAAWRELD